MDLNASVYYEAAEQTSVQQDIDATSILRDEAKHLISLAAQFTFTNILGYLPGVIALILVGHIDSPDLQLYIGAAALGDMYFNVTGYSTGLGIASAMDTLCSQAFGAGNVQRIGIVLQTGLIVLGGMFIPAFFLNVFAADVLIGLGQPMDVSHYAGQYAQCLLIGLPFLYAYELLKKTLQAQNIASPMIYCTIVCNIVNFVVGYCLINYCNMGFVGAALGRSAANISLPLSLFPYYWRHSEARLMWPGLQLRAAVKGLVEFLRIGVPGMLMMMFEWCSFECIAIFSGLLPNAVVALGANAITLNLFSFLDWIYFGIAVAATVRVGNAIGAGDAQRTKIAIKASFITSAITAALFAIILLISRNEYPYIFTSDTAIAKAATSVAIIVIAFQLPQAINQTTQGILRGCGLQKMGALINFIAYLLIGLPLGYTFAFVSQLEVVGLWLGMVAAFISAASIGIAILKCTNLDRIINEAVRINAIDGHTN
ncbi:Multidrug/Oligosaccharidyl-lipid/Polysaccharide (MOP) Flippase Superfamily [Thraustotheca clavata]|uniref:Multidrug/Oligosaccharidyl-lipid/Polysaccharide (MOP) Flippase Superfamily n=1 Tax=Thraustotheca clavata TaxID=74557 RepID=A0A1V9Z0X0_9STRA|nr:Multidrug/Oligosaccharidyl-lipid/Polysaccharide (MOP) Flippase Superfamily [Thraustotheca clavata]